MTVATDSLTRQTATEEGHPMKLYMHPISTTSRPVVLLAAEANIPLDLVVVDLMKGEHHGPAFVKLNPSRMVPVLEDGDFVLTESSAIMKYLAEKVESPLYPKDLKKRARVNERLDWFNSNFYRDWGYNLIYPQLYPHHKRASEEHNEATVAWGRDKAAAALKTINDDLLGSNKYLCGDSLTIADLFAAQLLSAGELIKVDFKKYPNVSRWLDTIKALASWKKINEAHDGYAASLAGKTHVAP